MSNLKSALSSYDKSLEKSKLSYSGKLGLAINGIKTVEHPTRNSFVYVRIGDNLSESILAFNDKVSPVYDLPVLIQRQGNRWIIAGRDSERYSDWGTSYPFLPKHADQHSFNRGGGGGGDVVAVYPDQFMPLLVYPSGTVGSGNMLVAPYTLQKDSSFIYVGNTGTPDVLIYKPTNSQAIMGLVYLDKMTGNPGILIASGTPFVGNITGSHEIVPYLPYPSSTQEPLYAFRLVSGTTSITWDNLYNVRQFVGGSTSTGTSSSSIPSGTYVDALQQPNRILLTDASGTVTTDGDLGWDAASRQVKFGQPSLNLTGINGINQVGSDGAALTNYLQSYADSNFGSRVAGIRGRGTKASPTGVLNGDTGLRLVSFYYDSSGTFESSASAQIQLRAGGTHTTGNRPTEIAFWTTPTGTTTLTEGFTLKSDGQATLLGALSLPASGLKMNTGTFNLTGGGTIALGGFTLTVPATLTVAGLAIENVFTVQQMVDGTADQIQLRVQGHSTQTTNLQTWENSAGTVVANIDGVGSVVFNPASTTTLTGLTAVSTLTNSNSQTVTGAAITGRVGAGSTFKATVTGIAVTATYGGTVANDTMLGVRGLLSLTSAVLNDTAIAVQALINTNSGTLSKFFGFKVGTNANNTTSIVIGTVTNAYGLYINPVTGATSLNYAIFTNAGQVSLLGDMTIASAAGAIWNAMEYRAATLTLTGTTHVTTATGVNYQSIARPTITDASAVTVDFAASLYIANAPVGAGAGPATITNPYSLWIDAGAARFDGNMDFAADGTNFIFGSTTGIKLGTATTQKLAFWNTTPIVQPANTVALDTLLVNLGLRATGGVALFDTDVKIGVVGNGLYVKEGTNATMGVATLVAGTVTVNTTKVTANSRIILTVQALGTILLPVGIGVTARTAGTSFTITSMDITDTSTVAWVIMEPA